MKILRLYYTRQAQIKTRCRKKSRLPLNISSLCFIARLLRLLLLHSLKSQKEVHNALFPWLVITLLTPYFLPFPLFWSLPLHYSICVGCSHLTRQLFFFQQGLTTRDVFRIDCILNKDCFFYNGCNHCWKRHLFLEFRILVLYNYLV